MNEEFVTIATTFDIVEAEYLRDQLQAEGFEVFLADENFGDVYNLLTGAVGGFKVKVSPDFVEEAHGIVGYLQRGAVESVDDEISEEAAIEITVDTGWGECKMCRSRDLTLGREALGWKWILVFFMISPVGMRRKLICNNCGFKWLEEK